MAVITKPTITKGTTSLITLNRVDLESLASAQGLGPHFSDSANWDTVTLYFLDSVLGQKKFVKFDCTKSEPWKGKLKLSANAASLFQVQKIIIIDHDGASKTIKRPNLTTAEFDINIVPPNPQIQRVTFKNESVSFGTSKSYTITITDASGTVGTITSNSISDGMSGTIPASGIATAFNGKTLVHGTKGTWTCAKVGATSAIDITGPTGLTFSVTPAPTFIASQSTQQAAS